MLLVFRYFILIVSAAFEHFGDGLAYPALAIALLLGWRGIRFYWLAAPILLSAIAAGQVYARATSGGKLSGAMGNFVFELMVFGLLSGLGYLAGWALRQRGRRS